MQTHRSLRIHPGRLLLGSLILACATLVGAQGPATAANHRAPLITEAERLTLDLAAAIRGYRQAPAAARSARLGELATIAQERQALLLELLDSDPAAVRRLALPEGLGAGLPETLTNTIEQRVRMEGELTVLFEDHDTADSHLRHFLDTRSPDGSAGERLELRFPVPRTDLASGTMAQARGLRLAHQPGVGDSGASLLLDAGSDSLLVLELDGAGTTTSTATVKPLPDTRGAQHTAVLLVNFADQPDNKPWTLEQARTLVFDSVSDFMLENSQQYTWLEGAASGWFTINHDSTSCLSGQISSKADQAATAAGIDLSRYRRIIYLFPRIASCGWAGSGTVGGNPSRAWSNGQLNLNVIGHELGHNFGLYHAHALECGTEVIGEVGESCTNIQYGDHFDIMGNNGPRHFNAFHKTLLGWLGQPDTPQVQEVTASGSYPIAPYITGGDAPTALKIARGADPASGAARWYYLEYREPVGFDSPLASNTNLRDGVLFHSAVDSDRNSSFALDLTPASQTNSFYDWDDPALIRGASYLDSSAGLRFETRWAADTGASIDISFGTPICVRAAPVLTLTPADGQWAAPGTAVGYSLNLSNNDSASCPPATFNLYASAPADWPAPQLAASLSLAPGATGAAPLTVTSPSTAAEGIYDIAVSVYHAADPTLAAAGSVTYVVQPVVIAPVAVDDSASTAENTAVIIPVLANDWDPLGQPLTLVGANQPAKGQVRLNGDGALEYTPNPRFKGSDSFSYQISTGVASASAVVTVQVLRSGGDRGKSGK
jgi:hypothetical protein